jgi:hypothetical protein
MIKSCPNNMPIAIGGSGDGGGGRHSSREKGKTTGGPQEKPKKMRACEKVILHDIYKDV